MASNSASFPSFPFYLTPDAILVTAGKTFAGFGYEEVEFMFEALALSRKRRRPPTRVS